MKLSIITINLNNAKGLNETILSVISQNYSDFEFIIIDGGSTDDSVSTIKRFTDKISYWISEPDSGIYNAMNKGINKARGEYLYFLNSGDSLIDKDVLTKVFGLDLQYDIIAGDVVLDSNKKNGRSIIKSIDDEDFTFVDFYERSLNHQATFFKKELFKKFGDYDESFRVISDWLFTVRMIIFGNVPFKCINMIISKIQPNGISSSLSKVFLDEKLPALKMLLPIKVIEDYENSSIQLVKRIKKYRYLWVIVRCANFIAKKLESI